MAASKKKYPLLDHPSDTLFALGIVTDEPDYRLCWLLNQWGNLGLSRSEDILAYPANSPSAQAYSCFMSSGTEHYQTIRLISNKSSEGIWLTSFKQVNYLLLVDCKADYPISQSDFRSLLTKLVPQIRGIFEIPVTSLPGL